MHQFVLVCRNYKLPCGDLKNYVDEVHGGRKDSIQMEFDHIMPLCSPGHVEKNILKCAITVLWNLIGLEKIAATCNFDILPFLGFFLPPSINVKPHIE